MADTAWGTAGTAGRGRVLASGRCVAVRGITARRISAGSPGAAPGFAAIIADSRNAYGWIFAPEATLPSLGLQKLAPATSGWAGNFIQEAVDFVLTHLPVLSELLDYVTGNYAELKQAAADWHTAGVRTLGVTGALAELAGVMGQTQKILEDAAAEASFAQQTISMIISEVIEWVAGNIAIDVLTAGLATGIEAVASAGFITEKITQAAEVSERLASVLRKGLEVGTVANLRYLGDGKLAGAAVKAFDVAGRGLKPEEVDEITALGKNGMALRIGANAVMSAAGELTGLPPPRRACPACART